MLMDVLGFFAVIIMEDHANFSIHKPLNDINLHNYAISLAVWFPH